MERRYNKDKEISMKEKKGEAKVQTIGLLAAIVAIVALIVCACVISFKPQNEPAAGGEAYAPLSYKIFNDGEEYNSDFDQRGYYVGTAADNSGVVVVTVASGMRSSGGYGISIAKVEIDGNDATITVEESLPDPGSLVTMALTYPIARVEFNRMPAKIVVMDSEGEIFEQR